MTDKKLASILAKLYQQEFYGKAKGRYLIKGEWFKRLAGKKEEEKLSLNAINKELMVRGLFCARVADNYVVLELKPILGYRVASEKVLAEYSSAIEEFVAKKEKAKRLKEKRQRMKEKKEDRAKIKSKVKKVEQNEGRRKKRKGD
ncbi:MAG: hypothetical protein AB2L22_08070 [Syntrophales bacterium]